MASYWPGWKTKSKKWSRKNPNLKAKSTPTRLRSRDSLKPSKRKGLDSLNSTQKSLRHKQKSTTSSQSRLQWSKPYKKPKTKSGFTAMNVRNSTRTSKLSKNNFNWFWYWDLWIWRKWKCRRAQVPTFRTNWSVSSETGNSCKGTDDW